MIMSEINFKEQKMLAIMKANKYGISISDLCKEHDIHSSSYYRWRHQFDLKQQIKKLESENRKLRKMYAAEWIRSKNF